MNPRLTIYCVVVMLAFRESAEALLRTKVRLSVSFS
jgi:hypothetical protein